VLIPAAGIGSRMQSAIPKQYLKIGESSVLEHSVNVFLSHPSFSQVHIGIAEHDSYFAQTSLSDHSQVSVYQGGKERSDSVLNGLNSLSAVAADNDWVWVHDAARPCLSHHDIDCMIAALPSTEELAAYCGLVLAAPLVDTIKVSKDGRSIDSSADRSELWRALTPQVFPYRQLKEALGKSLENGLVITDESSAIEQQGGRPRLVPGADDNIKITRPEDLPKASETLVLRGIILNEREKAMSKMPRIGTGYDVHAFCEGDGLVLGGVKIAHHKAFVAHSDGDVLLHALMDAMLGALALGDIGKHFPDTDARWKGANSRDLLVAVNELILKQGYTLANLDSVIIAQAPKMAPHIEMMRENIAQDLGLEISAVSVKATTTERLGFTGREEGIACQASVILVPQEMESV
jgi:2-C-methyl-D-erythritol 4-phosphate cytidylyltransferase / 2-C-methyl-D-erythritol 2,4-cyclodiphosphate synthase